MGIASNELTQLQTDPALTGKDQQLQEASLDPASILYGEVVTGPITDCAIVVPEWSKAIHQKDGTTVYEQNSWTEGIELGEGNGEVSTFLTSVPCHSFQEAVDGNLLHSTDEPTVRYHEMYEYYRHGVLHREDGPAVSSGSHHDQYREWWYFEGELHCGTGSPAVYLYDSRTANYRRRNGGKGRASTKRTWYLHGKKVTRKIAEAYAEANCAEEV